MKVYNGTWIFIGFMGGHPVVAACENMIINNAMSFYCRSNIECFRLKFIINRLPTNTRLPIIGKCN